MSKHPFPTVIRGTHTVHSPGHRAASDGTVPVKPFRVVTAFYWDLHHMCILDFVEGKLDRSVGVLLLVPFSGGIQLSSVDPQFTALTRG